MSTPHPAPASSPARGRGTGGLIERLVRLTPTSTLIRLTGPSLIGFTWTPGDHVRIPIGSLLVLRTYSIWDADATAGWLEMVLFDHGTPKSVRLDWAERLQPGQFVRIIRDPRRFAIDPGAAYHLFAGEETAAAGFGAMLRALPPDLDARGVIQANTAADHIALPRQLQRIERNGESAASSRQLASAVAAMDLPSRPGVAYLAGEARTIQLVRSHLMRERGWPRRSIRVKPFWTPGRRGMD